MPKHWIYFIIGMLLVFSWLIAYAIGVSSQTDTIIVKEVAVPVEVRINTSQMDIIKINGVPLEARDEKGIN